MYSKPLAGRTENSGLRDMPAKTSHRAPITSASFASYLPQGGTAAAGMGLPGALPGTLPGAMQPAGGATPIEQAATQNNFGLNQLKALAALTAVNAEKANAPTANGEGSSPLGMPLNPRDLFKLLSKGTMTDAESAETAVRVKSHRKKNAASKERVADVIARKLNGTLDEFRQNSATTDVGVGKLAANFESGQDGIAAIGYDRHGGTSYGKYQLSSRAGTMKKFTEFLQTEAPDMAKKLREAGASNTGGRRGKMPTAWKEIAEAEPERFEALQDKFIRASHFEPAMQAIADKTGIARGDMPFALQEVVFSTAVQHGPNAASRIISRALGQVGEAKLDPEKNAQESVAKAQENLIRKIYQNRSGQFQSSTETVQAAVKSRLKQEMSMAISMLRNEYTATVKA